jgi:hypothetical protein
MRVNRLTAVIQYPFFPLSVSIPNRLQVGIRMDGVPASEPVVVPDSYLRGRARAANEDALLRLRFTPSRLEPNVYCWAAAPIVDLRDRRHIG